MLSSVALDCFAAFVLLVIITGLAGRRVRALKMHWASVPIVIVATLPGFVQFFRAVLAPKAATIAGAERLYQGADHGVWHVFLGLVIVLPIIATLDARARRTSARVTTSTGGQKSDEARSWFRRFGIIMLIDWYAGVALLLLAPVGVAWLEPIGFGLLAAAALQVIGVGAYSMWSQRGRPTEGH